MSNFSFSHSVFYPFGELCAISIKFEIVVCKLFPFGTVLNLLFGKGSSWHKDSHAHTPSLWISSDSLFIVHMSKGLFSLPQAVSPHFLNYDTAYFITCNISLTAFGCEVMKQDGHDGLVLLHWLLTLSQKSPGFLSVCITSLL